MSATLESVREIQSPQIAVGIAVAPQRLPNELSDSHSSRSLLPWDRVTGVFFGVATQAAFLLTVVYLFLFLRFGGWSSQPYWFVVDSMLAVGFALPHSALLVPAVQKRIKHYVPQGLVGCIHCSVTCFSLGIMFHFWGKSEIILWEASGMMESIVLAGFYGSWFALFYSLYLTGLGYQTGFTPWWYWLIRSQPPRRQFVVRGAYRYMRHPVYMSFLGLIWFTPVMTLDHAILTGIWTIYIYAGSYFKDRRLIRFVGPEYMEYASRVPGLPLIGIGSLRRFSSVQAGNALPTS